MLSLQRLSAIWLDLDHMPVIDVGVSVNSHQRGKVILHRQIRVLLLKREEQILNKQKQNLVYV